MKYNMVVELIENKLVSNNIIATTGPFGVYSLVKGEGII